MQDRTPLLAAACHHTLFRLPRPKEFPPVAKTREGWHPSPSFDQSSLDMASLCLGRDGGDSVLSSALELVGLQKSKKVTTGLLADALDLDRLGGYFVKYAGSDETMDRHEFQKFTSDQNITRGQAAALWHMLDRDGSGQVDKAEFFKALRNLQQARTWLRYCPTCSYTNSCSYCQECNLNCTLCDENSFCADHWADHPQARAALETRRPPCALRRPPFAAVSQPRRRACRVVDLSSWSRCLLNG